MPESEPNPRQTLALLLGASSFRRAPKLAQGRAFYNSAQDFHEYLTGSDGLGLPGENVSWLFDDSRSPSDQLQDIRDFLENRSTALKNQGTQAQDLIVYYVGHGLFSGADHTYSLAIRATDERSEGLTSIRASDLASIIKAFARFLRKFLILDCCFSAAAYKEFQSGPLTAGRVKLLDELPQRGTTLLCSASAQDPSLAPEGLSRTMFSDSLLKALRQGHSSLGPRLSLSEIGDLVKVNIREAYPGIWVRPEVHSPDQREGDVASVALFPNAAYVAQKAEEARRKTEAECAQEEAAARQRTEAERKAREEAEEARRKAEAERTQEEAAARQRTEAERKAREEAEEARRKTEAECAQEEAAARQRTEAERKAREEAEEARRRVEAEPKTPQEESESKTRQQAKARQKLWIVASAVVLLIGIYYIFVRGREPLTLRGHGDEVLSVAWSPDGKRLATGSADNTAKVWDTATGKELLTLGGQSDAVQSVAWSPDGKRLATGNGDTARVWDAETGKQLLTLSGHSKLVYRVAWSPDGKRLATGSMDNTAKVWDPATGKELLTLTGKGSGVFSVAWSPEGKRLATGTWESVKVWDGATGEELLTLTDFGVLSLAWSPDGKQLATGNGTAKVWDAATGKQLLTLSGHKFAVWSVAWSPDGKRLATGSVDKTAKVWDPATGKELLTLSGHSRQVWSVAWSPDSKRLATGSADHTARVWDVGQWSGP